MTQPNTDHSPAHLEAAPLTGLFAPMELESVEMRVPAHSRRVSVDELVAHAAYPADIESSQSARAERATFPFSMKTAATDLRLLSEWLACHSEQGAVCTVGLKSAAEAETLGYVDMYAAFAAEEDEKRNGALVPEPMAEPREHPLSLLSFCGKCPEGAADAYWSSQVGWELHVLKDNALMLRCQMGHYDVRRWHLPSLSAAFARLSQLCSGELPWADFGSEEGRRTLLHKGEFFWSPKSDALVPLQELVPLSGFDVQASDGSHLRLQCRGERHHVYWQTASDALHEVFFDGFEALNRMADVLEGSVTPQTFGDWQEDGHLARAIPTFTVAPWDDHLVVRTERDASAGPSEDLQYRTREGKCAGLHRVLNGWEVRVYLTSPQWQVARFGVNQLPQALRCLAKVLRDGRASSPVFTPEPD